MSLTGRDGSARQAQAPDPTKKLRPSAGSADAGDLAPVDGADLDDAAGVRRVHVLSTAEVDADMADRAVEEDEVTRLRSALGDMWDGGVLRSALVREVDASLCPGVLRETRAVERHARVRGCVPIGHTLLAQSGVDSRAGAR